MRESAARLRLAQGRPEDALTELAAPVDYPEVRNPVWAPWRGLTAQALAATGHQEEALALADEEVELLRRWGAPTALGVSLRLRGELRAPAGTGDLREAVHLLSGGPALLEEARSRVALACSPGMNGPEGAALLQSALRAARACGARGVAAAAADALARCGQSGADDDGDVRSGLTTRQRRITELTAAGLDANEVAQRLFLTPGTVRAVLESTTVDAP